MKIARIRGARVTRTIAGVKTVTFEAFDVSIDGETLVFQVSDRTEKKAVIAIHWLHLSPTLQMMVRAAEKAAEKRRSLGKSDHFDGSNVSPQVVSAFQLIDVPKRHLKVLSLQCPSGFRCDFALSTDKVDQLGRPMPQAIAEELLSENRKSIRKRLNS